MSYTTSFYDDLRGYCSTVKTPLNRNVIYDNIFSTDYENLLSIVEEVLPDNLYTMGGIYSFKRSYQETYFGIIEKINPFICIDEYLHIQEKAYKKDGSNVTIYVQEIAWFDEHEHCKGNKWI